MNRYTINPAARSDLDDIWEYVAVANDNPVAAEKLMASFRKTFALLGNNPGVGLSRNDLATDIRLFPVSRYVVIFRPNENGVNIVQVIHGARDLETAFRDDDE